MERSVELWEELLLFGWRRWQGHQCGNTSCILHTCRWKVSLLFCCFYRSSRVLGDSVCPEGIVW